MAVKPIVMPPPKKRITFQEENMDFQGAIKKASEWAAENKDKIQIDSSELGCVYDQKYFDETGTHRYARCITIRYKEK